MAIRRAQRPANHFTQIRNDVLRDDRLSYRARGVLAAILSMPDDWSTSAEALTRQGVEGRDAIRTALAELEGAGYLRRQKVRDSRGRVTTEQVVFDTPSAPPVYVQETLDGPAAGFQASVNQASVHQPSGTQAPKEHCYETLGPTDPGDATAKPKDPADLIAADVYEALDKMGNYMALRQLAKKALQVPHQPEVVRAAMLRLVAEGRPISGQTLRPALMSVQGTTIRDDHHDHWNNGGGYAAAEGGGA